MSPLKKDYRVFFNALMITFKAVRCWLKLSVSDKAPRHWSQTRLAILSRITAKTRNPSKEVATVEELHCEPMAVTGNSTNSPVVMRKGRMEVCQRFPEIGQAVEYNLLERRKDDKMLLGWKSYPGMADIISKARYMI